MAHILRESRCTAPPPDSSSRATWETFVRYNLLAVQNQFARTLHRERNPTRRAAEWTALCRFLPPTPALRSSHAGHEFKATLRSSHAGVQRQFKAFSLDPLQRSPSSVLRLPKGDLAESVKVTDGGARSRGRKTRDRGWTARVKKKVREKITTGSTIYFCQLNFAKPLETLNFRVWHIDFRVGKFLVL